MQTVLKPEARCSPEPVWGAAAGRGLRHTQALTQGPHSESGVHDGHVTAPPPTWKQGLVPVDSRITRGDTSALKEQRTVSRSHLETPLAGSLEPPTLKHSLGSHSRQRLGWPTCACAGSSRRVSLTCCSPRVPRPLARRASRSLGQCSVLTV